MVILNQNTRKFFEYLIILIPISLISGPLIAELILVSCCFYLFYICIENKNFTIFYDKFFLIFLTFYFFLILSSLLSDNKLYSLKTSLPYIRYGIFFIFIKFILLQKNNLSVKLLNTLILIFVILFIDALVQKNFGKNLFGHSPPYGRITSFFGDDIKLGGFVSRFSPLLFALIFLFKKNNSLYVLAIIITILTILSGERTSFLMFMIYLILLFFFSKIEFKIKILTTSLFFIFSGTILFLSESTKNRYVFKTLSQLNFLNAPPYYIEIKDKNNNTVIHRDNSFLPRIYMMYFGTSKEIFNKNKIFGAGPRSYKLLSYSEDFIKESDHAAFSLLQNTLPVNYEKVLIKNPNLVFSFGGGYNKFYEGFTNIKSSNSHPHNFFLQLLCETGILGIIFYIFTLLFIFFRLLLKVSNFNLSILIGIFIHLNPLLFSGNFFNNWTSIIIYLSAAMLYAKNEK